MKIREFRENHTGRQNSRKLPKGSVQEEKRKEKVKRYKDSLEAPGVPGSL